MFVLFFGTNKGTLPQRAIARKLATFIYFGFLERLKSIVRQDEICEPVAFDVHEMSEVGLSKVRHVGGWAVRKVLSRARRYVQKNVHRNPVPPWPLLKINKEFVNY